MFDQSDSQNRSEEQVQLSECSGPSSSSNDGSRSTPRNLPMPATRARKKRTSDSEDEAYVAVEDEATSRKRFQQEEVPTGPNVKAKEGSNRRDNEIHHRIR